MGNHLRSLRLRQVGSGTENEKLILRATDVQLLTQMITLSEEITEITDECRRRIQRSACVLVGRYQRVGRKDVTERKAFSVNIAIVLNTEI